MCSSNSCINVLSYKNKKTMNLVSYIEPIGIITTKMKENSQNRFWAFWNKHRLWAEYKVKSSSNLSELSSIYHLSFHTTDIIVHLPNPYTEKLMIQYPYPTED